MAEEPGTSSKRSPSSTSASGGTLAAARLAAGARPAGAVPPKPPAPYRTFDPDSVEKSKINMLDSVMSLVHPASAALSAVATNRLSQVSIANGLGNERPTRALLSFSEDNSVMFIMPCRPGQKKSVEVRYDGQQCAMVNLWKPFAPLGKTAAKGMREYYAVEVTEEVVTIEDVTAFALWIPLVAIDEQPVKARKKKPSSGEPLSPPASPG